MLIRDEVYRVVGAAMEVYNTLGYGFLEAVYQEALELELSSRRIPFTAQAPLPLVYKGQVLKKHYVADLVCYDRIIVELKAIDALSGREEAQVLNYLRVARFRVGLLVNFGSPGKLEWRRFVW